MSSSKKEGGSSSSSMTTMGYFWAAREMLTPTLKKTAFLEKGVLTPEEFVRAGDELVYRCPTWSWATSTSSTTNKKSYLPADKQYLVTRNVPCRDRVAALEQNLRMEEEGGDDEDDWMISNLLSENSKEPSSIEDEFDVLDEDGEVVMPQAQQKESDIAVEEQQQDGEEDEYADMADFEDDNVLMDDDAAVAPKMDADADNDDDSHLVKVRTYDLTITYDKYYQTPRIWMSGKSAEGHPLSAAETMQDVMTDYANKTVTMEAHPFIPGAPHASIHPCQHGKVMKAIVGNLMKTTTSSSSADNAEQQQGPSVEMYLFIFLKFVSSIIPTINYDFTMDVTADTSKS